MLKFLAASLKAAPLSEKIVIGVILIALILVPVGVHLYHNHTIASLNAEQVKLKDENQKATDGYNQKIGEAHANELAAKEEKAKADAVVASIDAHAVNVKQLDSKLEQVNQNYEKSKSELGDCADTNDCLKKLQDELKAAGFIVR